MVMVGRGRKIIVNVLSDMPSHIEIYVYYESLRFVKVGREDVSLAGRPATAFQPGGI